MIITLENAQKILLDLSSERAKSALDFIGYLYEQEHRQLVDEVNEARHAYQTGNVRRGTVEDMMTALDQ